MSGDSAGLNDIMLFRSGCRHGWSSIYMCGKGWCSVGDSAGLNGIMLVWCLGVSRVGLVSGCWKGWSSVWVLARLV